MATRETRRKEHKLAVRIGGAEGVASRRVALWYLTRWRAEVNRRADDLGEPAVWALLREVESTIRVVDPDGGFELAADLRRLCAEAVARVAGPHMARGSRPPADRARVGHVRPEGRGR